MIQDAKKPAARLPRNRPGAVLVLTLFVVLLSLIIGTGMLTMGTQARIEAITKVQDLMARSAADAGLEYAIQEINNAVADGVWTPAVLPTTVNAALCDSDSIYSVQSKYDSTTGYTVESVGINRDRTRSVTAVLRLKGLFDMAVQARKSITLKSGTVIQAIDSSISLNPADTDETVTIGTNSTDAGSIVLNNGVIVDGHVVVGVGGDIETVIKDLGAATLDRYALTAELEFPLVSPPALNTPNMLIQVSSGEQTIGTGGDYPASGRFSGLKLKNSCRLRVISPCVLYITGDVDMGQSSEIIVDSNAGGSLAVYLDGNWIADNNAGVTNATQRASAFQLYGTGGPGQVINLKAKGDLFGSVYAPNADLTIYSGGNIYGSLTANSFELKNPAKFFYDVTLLEVDTNDEGVRYVINRWNEQ